LLALHYSLEGWQAGMPSEILFLQRRVGNVSRPLFTPVLYDDSKKQTGDVAMNWDAIGAMGEVVGAVAVVITLLYVARQIHQANAQTRASARYSFIEAYGHMNSSITESKKVASIFRRGLKGEDFDEDEFMQFFALLGQFLNTWSVLYDLHEDGLLPENQWAMVKKDIITMLSEPGGRDFWKKTGQFGVHDAFSKAVNDVLDSDETSYQMF